MIKTVSGAGTARLVSVRGELRVLAETDGLRQRVELRLLNGKTMREAHKQAVATAAFVCTKSGAWPEYVK